MRLAADLLPLQVSCVAASESQGADDGGDVTGARPWLAGVALAAFLASDVDEGWLRGRSVIELGCGAAPLPSAVSALRGAAPCVATDGSSSHLDGAMACLRRNGLLRVGAGGVECRPLRWGEVPAMTEGCPPQWDIVLFADCVYTDAAASQLAEAIVQLLRRGDEARVFAAMGLFRVGVAELFPILWGRGLHCKEIQLSRGAREATALACEALRGVHEADLVGGLSATSLAASVRLVEWRWPRASDEAPGDEHRRLREEFQMALYTKEMSLQSASGWMPEE